MHGHIRERKEIPNNVKLLKLHFAMLKHIDVISSLVGNSGEMVIYTFLLGFSSPSRQKVIRVLSTRDYLILLITNTNHKAHLLSCA